MAQRGGGGAFTPLLVILVLELMHWRWAFVLFGSIGVVWAVFFYRWFRDDPREHPGVNAAELALMEGSHENASGHGDVPWGKFLSSGTVWMLWLRHACMSDGWYFYVTGHPPTRTEVGGLAWRKAPAPRSKECTPGSMSPGPVERFLSAFGGIPAVLDGLVASSLGSAGALVSRPRTTARVWKSWRCLGWCWLES